MLMKLCQRTFWLLASLIFGKVSKVLAQLNKVVNIKNSLFVFFHKIRLKPTTFQLLFREEAKRKVFTRDP